MSSPTEAVELWRCPVHGLVQFADTSEQLCPVLVVRHYNSEDCDKPLTGPHRYVPESESINKAELVEWLEERRAMKFQAFRQVLDHINESEGER